MTKKISIPCIVAGTILLAVCGIASYYKMAYEVYLIIALLLFLEGLVSYFSRNHLVINCIVALLAFVEITGSILIGMIPFSIIGIALVIACIVLERTLWKA